MGIETNISDDALDALHERITKHVKDWVRNSDTTGGAAIERRVYLRKLLEEVAGELSACQETLQREKDCQEQFAIRIMGEERYSNSACQAHPLELVEQYLGEYFDGLKREMLERINSMESAVKNLQSRQG